MMRRAVLTVILVAAFGVTAQPAVATTVVPQPTHIAALGDSITRAFDVNGSYFLKDAPEKSWATGADGTVQSQFLLLQKKFYSDPTTTTALSRENDAVTGAKMTTLDDQMNVALGHGADYITVLMGANDVCTKTVSGSTGMTSTSAFQTQFQEAMSLVGNKTGVQVFVASIPNVNHLYDLFSKNSSARFIWSLYGVCQDLLSSKATAGDRTAVANQVIADNKVLAAVCGQYSNCTWDNLATYSVSFATTDVSTVDYFHPSVAGQNKLASVAWGASPYAP